ncbi:transposase [Bradyrhizobium sp. GM6.1]
MDDTPSARRNARCSKSTARAVCQNHRPPDDQWPRCAIKVETVTIAAIEKGVPLLVETREIIIAFHAMIRKKTHVDVDPWLERACASLVASFANGITKDKAAINAAITTSWSNGQTEGQITKLKLVKRQMYGRAKLDLLQARLIGAT